MSTKLRLLIRAYNIKELAALYEINRKTMARWLKRHKDAIGEKTGYYYTIAQVDIIIEKLGIPGKWKDLD